jgi:hypothetical protein
MRSRLHSEVRGRVAIERAKAMIKIKRVYDIVDGEDAVRVFVDRFSPGGNRKDAFL